MGQLYDELESRMLTSSIEFVVPDVEQSRIAAHARHQFPLNLGDCFACALAVARDLPIITLDQGFHRMHRPVILPQR